MSLIPIPASADPDVKESFRKLNVILERLTGGSNVDWHGRRIINAGKAVNPGDYVTLEQVEEITGAVAKAAEPASSPVVGGSGSGGGGTGDVTGPASSTGDDFAQYNGTTGKIIKDGGYSPSSFDAAGAAAAVAADLVTHEADPDAHKGEKRSIVIDAGDLQLSGDVASPGNNKVYGTGASGVRGWKNNPAGSKWSVLTVGSVVAPDFIWDSNGDVIMTETPR